MTWIGQEGRPLKAMPLGQAVALLETVESGTHRLAAYVILSLLAGVRTEEARALTWDEVDLKAGTVAVYRSVRVKGDTKTRKSRRVLKLPTKAVHALCQHRLKPCSGKPIGSRVGSRTYKRKVSLTSRDGGI